MSSVAYSLTKRLNRYYCDLFFIFWQTISTQTPARQVFLYVRHDEVQPELSENKDMQIRKKDRPLSSQHIKSWESHTLHLDFYWDRLQTVNKMPVSLCDTWDMVSNVNFEGFMIALGKIGFFFLLKWMIALVCSLN